MRVPEAAACVRDELRQFVHAAAGVVDLDV
jgi:hypothetical protein